jgi:saccharopine dehydrogenase-like NADP-dependent oxidoreductase
MNIALCGAGLVGRAIAIDLAQDSDVDLVAIDLDPAALAALPPMHGLTTLQADFRDTARLAEILSPFDLAVCAVPGHIGFETLRQIITAGKDVVDISFFSQDPFDLDDLAKAQGVTAVVDCGLAPGLGNVLAGFVEQAVDQIDSYECYVGGLPKVRQWPFEYKAVFSPSDVLEEYTRPARLIEAGREVIRPALSEIELIDFPQIGTLEAFNTDGLRTLRQTLSIPTMKEKTLRYPGHANLMRIFRDSGFLDTTPVVVDGQKIRPLDVTSHLLFNHWRMAEGETDITIMRVAMTARKGARRLRYTYDLWDEYDAQSGTTSMARTTGYTCSAIVRQVARGLLRAPGICPPEFIGRKPECFEALMQAYRQRHITLNAAITPLN